jgi:xanthine dehydrogenase accessory factor
MTSIDLTASPHTLTASPHTLTASPHALGDSMLALDAERRPYVHATVVRAQDPTSARPGDTAIIHEDGSIEGFVGGQCAQGSVRAAALGTLRDGHSLLLRVLPDGGAEFPQSPGALVVMNPCHSGGALEIFLRPVLPPPIVAVVGTSPISAAVAELAGFLGFVVDRESPSAGSPASPHSPAGLRAEAVAVIIASLGHGEEEAIHAALDAGVEYIGLVASRRRGTEVLDRMKLTDAERARVRTPVGLEIGARSPQEIALSAMADLVRAMRVEGLAAPEASTSPVQPRQERDPVCGMTVVVGPDTPHWRDADGEEHWFCCTGCRDSYAAAHTDDR